jgi:hypothetical protein
LNVGDIKRRVSNQLGDDSLVVFEGPDLVDIINDVQTDIVRKTHCLYTTSLISTVSGTEDYPVPVDLIEIDRVTYQGTKLRQTTFQELDQYDPDRDTTTSSSQGIPSHFHVEGNRLFLYPVPSTSVANAVKIGYTKSPATLVIDGDVPEIPTYMHEDIVVGVIARGREQVEDYQAAISKMSEYNQRVSLSVEQAESGSDESYPAVRDIETESMDTGVIY